MPEPANKKPPEDSKEPSDNKAQQTPNNNKASKAYPADNDTSSGSGNNKALKVVLIVLGVLLVIGVLIVLAAAAIFKSGADVVQEAIDETASRETEEQEQATDNGLDFSQEEQELPETFPEAVPLFEPSSLTNVHSSQQGSRATYSLIYSTEESTNAVAGFYETELEQNDWDTVRTYSSNDTRYIEAQNEEENVTMSVNIVPVSGENMTNYNLTVQVDGS